MFRKLIPYFFTFLYLVAMLRPVAPFVNYVINYDYITQFLCVNKDKPELKCNGTCYLVKEIKQQKKKDLKSLQISIKDYPIGFFEILSLEDCFLLELFSSKIYFNKSNYKFDNIFPFYHPPEIIA